MGKAKILVVDDEKLLKWSLEQSLLKEDYEVFTAEKGLEGLGVFKDESPDLTVLDIHLPDISGITVLEAIKEINRDAAVLMITAFGDVRTAVKAIKLGAYDFIEKPFNMDKLKLTVAKALETRSLKKEVMHLRSQMRSRYGFESLIGTSAAMGKITELIKKVAKSDASTVFLQGESGSGKDLVAKVIHYQSSRADRPFVEINCTALPETLIESELFGFEKGAFTDAKAMKKGLFELAEGGTIYLDEIADMKINTQSKLLKVIENKSLKRLGGVKDIDVDLRVIAATNKVLDDEVRTGAFREDLFYRLNVIPVSLAPLRGRKEDIPLLARHFIDIYNREFRKNTKGLSIEAEELFLSYDWPGNVRELKNVIERAMIFEDDEFIGPESLPLELSGIKVRMRDLKAVEIKLPPDGVDVEAVEKELIRQALDSTKGNQTRAARLLALTRDALRYRMQKFGFLPEKE